MVNVALHAVAIDEPLKVFDVAPMEQQEDNKNRGQILRQVWFPGDRGGVESLLAWQIFANLNFNQKPTGQLCQETDAVSVVVPHLIFRSTMPLGQYEEPIIPVLVNSLTELTQPMRVVS